MLSGHTEAVYAVAVSPEGTRVAIGSIDGTARIWNAVTGKELVVLKGHQARIVCIAFSPDATRLATGSADKTARLWGLSDADIHRNRLASAERRSRLSRVVEGWFEGDLAAVKTKLAEAKSTMSADDWREARNLVVTKAQERLGER